MTLELPVPEAKLPAIVDGTWLGAIQRCWRYGYYAHVMHLRPRKVAVALNFGIAIHDAVHVWYTGKHPERPDDDPVCEPKSETAAQLAIHFTLNNKDIQSNEDSRNANFAATVVLPAYFEEYATEPFEVVGSEIGFCFPLEQGSNIVYGGRFDRLLRWEDGRLMIADTKTTSRLGSYYMAKFRPHLSITGYITQAGVLMGEQIFGCMIDAISTAKNPQSRFLRDITTRTPAEVQEWKDTVKDHCHEFLCRCRMAEEVGPLRAFPQCPGEGSCHLYSGCEFRRLCVGAPNDTLIDGLYVRKAWLPYIPGVTTRDSEDDPEPDPITFEVVE